jgi:hypothetical protein
VAVPESDTRWLQRADMMRSWEAEKDGAEEARRQRASPEPIPGCCRVGQDSSQPSLSPSLSPHQGIAQVLDTVLKIRRPGALTLRLAWSSREGERPFLGCSRQILWKQASSGRSGPQGFHLKNGEIGLKKNRYQLRQFFLCARGAGEWNLGPGALPLSYNLHLHL